MGSFASFTLAPAGRPPARSILMLTQVTETFRLPGVAAVWRALAFTTLLALTACASLVPPSVTHPPTPPGTIEPAEPEATPPAAGVERSLRVKASAYNSVRGQTDRTPSIGAWGDPLEPGMKVIAVSADLLELGLARGQVVRIRGLDGDYKVADRMSKRWARKIDIYMGTDVNAARRWGVREVEIVWTEDADESATQVGSAWPPDGN